MRIKNLMITCEACAYASVCPTRTSYTPPKDSMLSELDSLLGSWDIKPSVIELPTIVPEIPVEEPVKLRWSEIGIEAIIVNFGDPRNENIKRAMEDGIKDLLHFNGTVLLSTIMPDRLLNEETFKLTLELVKKGGFDGIIGWDMPVYIDAPKMINIPNLIQAILFTARYVIEGVQAIPLLKGSDPREMGLCAKWLERLGFKQVALHATEYVLSSKPMADDADIITNAARNLYGIAMHKILTEMKARPLVIGVMSPRSFPFLLHKEHPEASFAGMGWYLQARQCHIYHGSRIVDLRNSVMECNCKACRGKSSSGTFMSVEDLAEHNLIQIKNFVKGEEVSNIHQYDAIVKEGTIAVVADLHIGTLQSIYEVCIDRLKEIKPSYLVFLGDTFDFVNGKPVLFEVSKFMDALREIEAEIIPLLGCSDSSWKGLFETLQRISFKRGPLKPQLLKPNFRISEAVRDLIMFYTAAKEKAVVKLANGRIVIFKHGYGLFKKGDDPKDVAKAILRDKEPNEIYVVGHYHKSHFDPGNRIAILGAWQTPTWEEEEAGFIPDIMEVLLIRADGEMELMRIGYDGTIQSSI